MNVLRTLFIVLVLTGCQNKTKNKTKDETPPNVVVIFCDDMGYADITPFGATEGLTPNLSQMAEQGIKLTNFYSGYSSCTCSRAALLTGSYPQRLGLQTNFLPKAKKGLSTEEMTIADLLKQKDYKTAAYGKWHLGDAPEFMPLNQGFDEFYGFPYSHDMWPFHPLNDNYDFPPLPLYNGSVVINPNVEPKDIENMTMDLTSKAVDFIERSKADPFFIYMAYPLPHVPLSMSKEFDGKTKQGTYADVVAELDAGVGQLLKTLKERNLEENTLVVFTSDNGPWVWYGEHGGSADPLRGYKGTFFEGGYRMPCVIRWPTKIPAGTVSDAITGTIDLLPTLANISNAPLSKNKIDGKNIIDILTGSEVVGGHEAYFYNKTAVRMGDWKLILPHKSQLVTEPGKNGHPGKHIKVDVPLSLYNLKDDVGETQNLTEKNQEIVSKLKAVLLEHNLEIETNQRPIGEVK